MLFYLTCLIQSQLIYNQSKQKEYDKKKMTKESKSCQKLAPIFFTPGPTLSHKNIENKEPYGDGGAMTLCDTVSFKGFLCLYENFQPFFCVVHLFIFL